MAVERPRPCLTYSRGALNVLAFPRTLSLPFSLCALSTLPTVHRSSSAQPCRLKLLAHGLVQLRAARELHASREHPDNALLAGPSAAASDLMFSWFIVTRAYKSSNPRSIPVVRHAQRGFPVRELCLLALTILPTSRIPARREPHHVCEACMAGLFCPWGDAPQGVAPF